MTDGRANVPAGSSSERPPSLVCFDLGGVVVRICRSWAEAARRVGLPEDMPAAARSPENTARRRELSGAYQIGSIACDAYFNDVSETTGGALSPADIQRAHLAWITGEYPGIADLTRELNNTPGVRTACLSNTNHAHWQGMTGEALPTFAGAVERSDALMSLGTRLASHLLRTAKPGPRIYADAQRKLGAGPADIVFFDDLEENIDAARAAGWHARLIDHTGDTAAQVRTHLAGLGVL